ncbi:hypothetical protein E1292_14315 [Nonomuraea deserti]|uniref:Uncharacterized protein n=2 Tax=Nonomuraea deserti TaxID=1848322 RepID=A0A4R4VMF5_9ACTN|nr:hypothetical protein E1292_14315 [Nonomuraea deserti]
MHVEYSALEASASSAEDQQTRIARARDILRAAFDRDRRTLGDDQYGAELENQLPEIENEIFDAFHAYIHALGEGADRLRVSVRNYKLADGDSSAG